MSARHPSRAIGNEDRCGYELDERKTDRRSNRRELVDVKAGRSSDDDDVSLALRYDVFDPKITRRQSARRHLRDGIGTGGGASYATVHAQNLVSLAGR